MFTHYKLPGGLGVSSLSPFCLKVDAFLEVAGIPHQCKVADLRKAPRGKAPYLVGNGVETSDSHAICALLHGEGGHSIPMCPGHERSAAAHAARVIAENSLYWMTVHSRWYLEDGWVHLRPHIEKLVPGFLRGLLPRVIRKQTLRQLRAVGTSRYPQPELEQRLDDDLTALVGLLGDSPFLGGDTPCYDDIAVYAQLAVPLRGPDSYVKRAIAARCKLVALVDQVDTLRQSHRTELTP